MSIKQNIEKKRRKRYKMDGPKSKQKRRNHRLGGPQGEYEQIKYLIPLVTRSILNKGRGGTIHEEQLEECLVFKNLHL
jgi:hypothetical protein